MVIDDSCKACAIFSVCRFEIQHGSSPCSEIWGGKKVFQAREEDTMTFQEMRSARMMAQNKQKPGMSHGILYQSKKLSHCELFHPASKLYLSSLLQTS